MAKRWNTAQRRKALAAGHALPPDPGRFPIEDCDDVDNAVADLNRPDVEDKEEVRAFITRRAIALGCPLPESWRLRRAE